VVTTADVQRRTRRDDMPPSTWVQHLAETEQIALIRAATVM
jgi:hypothetical protein